MLPFTLFTTLTLLHLTVATPTKPNSNPAKPAAVVKAKQDDCISNNFNNPWILRDIFVWQAQPTNLTAANATANQLGNINFLFFDVNKDLEMMTECDGALINGATEDKNGGYTLCKNSTVAFKFTKNHEVLLERAYIDPCLGQPPWDGGIAFGQRPTQIRTRAVEGLGQVGTRVRLEVPITSMS